METFGRSSAAIGLFLVFFTSVSAHGDTFTNLDFLKQLDTGTHEFFAGGESFDGYVDHDGTNGWLLVGRGREGWNFSNASQGSTASVSQNLGVPTGFAPAHYSSTIINDLIQNSTNGIDLTDLEIRIRRATNPSGTAFQESRWRALSETTWRWDFDNPYDVEYEILSGAGSPFLDTASNTRDGLSTVGPDTGNDIQRIFTWAWGGHNNVQGFSFGSSVSNGANNATSFLWENGNENHAIPYTEVYIRNLQEPNIPLPEPTTIALWSLLGIGLVSYRRWRRS